MANGPYNEDEKAALAKKRGQAAAYITDPDQRRKFIAEQGDTEKKDNLGPQNYSRLEKDADNTTATQGENKASNIPTYHKGTSYVPKTGKAVLKKGEAVLDTASADKYRANLGLAEGPMAHKDSPTAAKRKPAKAVKSVHIRKATKGGFIAENHHTDMAHPMEEHALPDMASLQQHMQDSLGTEGGADEQEGQEA